ncbi:MarR family winged helix-turn-helix transcriptional regulator [Paraflavitalea sp. CAU 1676]|uniref:MarR family winged helix-turn-helix transcriptional regulator n=1 Tax=Paraflavitalea sp. CAU 1676 TaxID=3032598 RepID=UPI0023DCE965|nr:MarR family winged helix-turn-helix transcriptional regulator [Paraflavitalea sp. CAU 1676]MDF2189691.1 MarR family winged helix-turn-helix transcriptional regulator [Paraflavitalea sp. CAU 1676]
MSSEEMIPFELEKQNSSADALIVAALERIGESIRVMLWEQAKEHGLSPIQVQSLIFLYTHDEGKANVTYLSKEFNVTKATMSEVIKVLSEKKLLMKKDNPADTRAQLLKLTAQGKRIAATTGGFANALLKHIGGLTDRQKTGLKTILLDLIYNLYQEKVITMQRMCFTCTHYDMVNNKPYCNLLNITLTPDHLRLDCPEHEQK